MRMTCRFQHSRAARVASRALVAVFIWTGLLPGAGRGVVHASDITPPDPAPVREPIKGFIDTHIHQFANLAFGGLEVWGSPVDPTLDPAAFLANPNAARTRALPNSDFIYLSSAQAVDYLGLTELPATSTPAATFCDNGSCWPQCPPGTGVQGSPCWRIEIHGVFGHGDLLNKLIAQRPEHGTVGYPLFDGWPAFDIVTAQQVYWEWLEHAHDHGLKMISMLAVNNQVLCHLAVHRVSFGCDDDSSVDRQIEAAKKLEEYIDAVKGGPGSGFYRIVYSAAEARQAIHDNKLAVVLGVEVDTPWRCRVDGFCTDDDVRTEVQRYYDKGIRVVYPVHLMDNGFGGSAAYDGLFEISSALVNGGLFFDLRAGAECAPGVEWRSDIRATITEAKGGLKTAIDSIVAIFVGAPVLGPFVIPLLAPLLPVVTLAVSTLATAIPLVSLYVPALTTYLSAVNPDFARVMAVLEFVAPVLAPIGSVALVAALAFLIETAPGAVGGESEGNCNHRGLQPLGTTLVNELMDHHMMIDIDHSDAITRDDIMKIAKDRKYPGIVAGHAGLMSPAMTRIEATAVLADQGKAFDAAHTWRNENQKTDDMVHKILDLGGFVSLAFSSGTRDQLRDYDATDAVAFDCGKSSQAFAQLYLYATKTLGLTAVGFGSDLNGFATWPRPRYGPRFCGTVPGESIGDIGPTYNPNQAVGGLDYTKVKDYDGQPFDKYQFGARRWDFNVDGFAHVGLYPDFIADLEAIGLTRDELAPIFNGVEGYVRMWERVDDDQAPTVRCGTVGEDWHDADQSVPCIAFDTGFDLANAADASFSLSTSVPAGAETDDAATGTHPAICDKGGHCTAVVAAITGINVDKKAPDVVVATPAAGTPSYTVGQVVTADYSCTDLGSGIATCAGPAAAGGSLDTSVGAHAFTVNATDKVGHATSVGHPYVVGYAICPLYDPTVTKKAGSTVPIKVRLCDGTGANMSSPSLVLHATGVTRTTSNTPATLEDSGNANPDFDFRYDASIGGYIFNLSTRGYVAGTYVLTFTASGDPTPHSTGFAVR